jgi:hypothetical protein
MHETASARRKSEILWQAQDDKKRRDVLDAVIVPFRSFARLVRRRVSFLE